MTLRETSRRGSPDDLEAVLRLDGSDDDAKYGSTDRLEPFRL